MISCRFIHHGERMVNGLFFGSKDHDEMKKLKFSMIAYYAVIIIGITIFISFSTINKTDDVLKTKVGELTNHLNVQMQMNMDSYLSRVETMATLVFTEKETYTYDATDSGMDEYDALNIENEISDRLYSICLMENFVDFSIIYSNNHTVGKLSNNTKDLFGDRLYEDLSAVVNRVRTKDGWMAGYSGNYNRIYYVKRVNDNAILVTSFYTTELESVFEHPGGISDITIRLVDRDDVMLYSSEDGMTGSVMRNDIRERINGLDSSTFVDDTYLITVSRCGDDWRVICSVPTQVMLEEQTSVQLFILTIGVVAAIIAIALSMMLSFGISNSVDKTFTVLNNKAQVDQLTGIYNKRSFETKVESALKHARRNTYFAVILFDVDNFKSVNDTYGHDFGDKVLAGAGEIMRKTFRSDDYLGRLGGDEFCVFMTLSAYMTREECVNLVGKKASELCRAFDTHRFEEKPDFKVSISAGAAIYPFNGSSFSSLYKAADGVLYISKKKGKNTFTICEEDSK